MSTTSPHVRPVAVLPVKNLEQAKQRLAPLLAAPARQALYRAMLQDVMCALSDARLLAGVLVVTRDPWAQALATEHRFEVLVEPENRGHTAASTLGARTLAERDTQGMLQVPGDLPLLKGDDVDALLRAHAPGRAVTIAPSRDRRGSNAVMCSPPDLLPLRFGDDSFFPHLQRSRSLGIEPTVVERAGFAFDVDTPDDLAAVMAEERRDALGWNTRAYLERTRPAVPADT